MASPLYPPSLMPRIAHDPSLLTIVEHRVSDRIIEYITICARQVLPHGGSLGEGPSTGVCREPCCPPLDVFIRSVVYRSRAQMPTLLGLLVLLDRLRRLLPVGVHASNYCTIHRLFLTTFILAAKSCNDASPTNGAWIQYSGDVFTTQELLSMERELLAVFHFDISFTDDEQLLVKADELSRFLSVWGDDVEEPLVLDEQDERVFERLLNTPESSPVVAATLPQPTTPSSHPDPTKSYFSPAFSDHSISPSSSSSSLFSSASYRRSKWSGSPELSSADAHSPVTDVDGNDDVKDSGPILLYPTPSYAANLDVSSLVLKSTHKNKSKSSAEQYDYDSIPPPRHAIDLPLTAYTSRPSSSPSPFSSPRTPPRITSLPYEYHANASLFSSPLPLQTRRKGLMDMVIDRGDRQLPPLVRSKRPRDDDASDVVRDGRDVPGFRLRALDAIRRRIDRSVGR